MAKVKSLTPLKHRLFSGRIIGEILTKPWIDNVIPVLTFLLLIITMAWLIPGFFSASNMTDMSQQIAEFGLIALALCIVMLSGGIDLSIGSMFALCVLAALTSMNVLELPVGVVLIITLLMGASCGFINGFLIGYLRLRAFITTLVTLVIFRAIYDYAFPQLASKIVSSTPDSEIWDYLGFGEFWGIPISFIIFAVLAITLHIIISRLRPGWHLRAVGGARKSAYNSGINVKRTVCIAYLSSGLLTAVAAFLFSARLGSTGADTGIGMEIAVLTAVVLGGVSLGGGRGSVGNALIGAALVLILTNSLIRLSMPGSVNQLILGMVLILAVLFDAKWVKNRGKILNKLYVSPTFLELEQREDNKNIDIFEVNDILRKSEIIGFGDVEGPEDVILDREGHLYTGTRHGTIVKFFAPDYKEHEIFARIGGHPLGLAFDADGNLTTCVGGMGVYQVTAQGEVKKVTDETKRSLFSIIDDSRLRLPDDLDIAPDGRIFFSEATIRYEMSEWAVDALEGRGNGRLLVYDPKTKLTKTLLRNLIFPNGITICPDGNSLLFAETWACRINRFWFDGPKKGTREIFINNLPGYPDNINRSSSGYWIALLGMRTKAFDLAMKKPRFRKRMAKRLGSDEWLFPNINRGCVVHVNNEGNIDKSLWDEQGENLPSITSMREHKGWLFMGGVTNNRIGRIQLKNCGIDFDPNWDANEVYWPKATGVK